MLSTPHVRPRRIGGLVAALALAGVAAGLVLVSAGASGVSPVKGTLAVSVCAEGSGCSKSWIAAWSLGAARARSLTPRVRAAENRVDDEPSWSGDGRRLAFLRVTSTTAGVYVVGADGTGLRRVASLSRAAAGADIFMGPELSPDGQRVVFDRYGNVECSGAKPFRHRLTIARADGRGAVDVPVLGAPTKYATVFPLLAWSPDGGKLLYSVAHAEYDDEDPGGCRWHGPSPSELYAIGADGRGRRLLASSEAEFEAAAWSPDARRVAYSSCARTDEEGGTVRCDLVVVGAAGTGRRTLVGSGGLDFAGGIAWSAKGDEVIANVGDGLVAVNASSGRRRRVGASGVILGVSGDGRYVATGGWPVRLQPLLRRGPTIWLESPGLPPGAVGIGEGQDLYLR